MYSPQKSSSFVTYGSLYFDNAKLHRFMLIDLRAGCSLTDLHPDLQVANSVLISKVSRNILTMYLLRRVFGMSYLRDI